ncbi:MAG: transcriptional repressor [Alphaproteobacteria bacterium]|nr:transcriptional repressor [Alphaproteobacteria bacterium]
MQAKADTGKPRRYGEALRRLRAAGLRPTHQRLGLAHLLFDAPPRHVTAESLHAEAAQAGVRVSLATVYNTLHQFVGAGLLREVVVDAGRAYFDTNVAEHHHMLLEDSGELRDIAAGSLVVGGLPEPPQGYEIARAEVVVRLRRRGE